MPIMTQTPVAGACQRIAPGVLRLTAPNPSAMTGPGTNTYLVGEEATVVIDPGVADTAHVEAIITHAPGPISAILVTHKHPDHTGGAAALSARTGAPVHGDATPLAGPHDPDFMLDAPLAHGAVIAAGAMQLEAVHTPGHTPDHLCFLLREQGLLFAGDAVMAGVTVVIIPPDGDMRTYFQTLDQLRALALAAIAPGHGRVLANPMAEIDHIIEHRRQRETQVLALLQEEPASVAELAARIYPEVPKALHGMAQAQLTAHLLKLKAESRVRRDVEQRWSLRQYM